MTPSGNVDSFKLIIEMTGLCLYVWDWDAEELTVFMPDARRKPVGFPDHPDGTTAVPHAGYLRFDLKDLDTGIAHGDETGSGGSPSYEVVHRFQGEDLVLNLPEGDAMERSLRLPDFGTFAPVLRPRPELYNANPPCVVMRMRLVGGEIFTRENARFREDAKPIHWKIDGDLHPRKEQTWGPLEGEVEWGRMLKGPGLDLVLSRFDGSGSVTIPLVARAVNGGTPEIHLKLANLCDNPLEWNELESPPQPVIDLDFKWLYQLMELRSEDAGKYPDHLCPVPEPILIPDGNQGDCRTVSGGKRSGGDHLGRVANRGTEGETPSLRAPRESTLIIVECTILFQKRAAPFSSSP